MFDQERSSLSCVTQNALEKKTIFNDVMINDYDFGSSLLTLKGQRSNPRLEASHWSLPCLLFMGCQWSPFGLVSLPELPHCSWRVDRSLLGGFLFCFF